jgi:hypothetical protein
LPTSSGKGAEEKQVIQVLYYMKRTEDAEIVILYFAVTSSEHVFCI